MNRCMDYVEHILAKGDHAFTPNEVAAATGESLPVVRERLYYLKEEGRVVNLLDDFHLVLPPNRRRLGCLYADEFVNKLMEYLDEPYYAAVLTAAMYHGASHQKPMVSQLMVSRGRPMIECGGIRVRFLERRNMEHTPCVTHDVCGGHVRVATAEATALEVVGYYRHAGFWDNVATILVEICEEVNGDALETEARRCPVAWSQRLGYVLELVGWEDVAVRVENALSERETSLLPLTDGFDYENAPVCRRWNIAVNEHVDPDVEIFKEDIIEWRERNKVGSNAHFHRRGNDQGLTGSGSIGTIWEHSC